MAGQQAPNATAVIERLRHATDDQDLDGIVGCFAADYRNETPVHPARGFVGPDQVRRNWAQILAAVPDLRATILRTAEHDDVVWAEWEMHGTRLDGARHLMRGVTISGVEEDSIAWMRFFLEPVDPSTSGVDAAVREQLVVGSPAVVASPSAPDGPR